MNHPVRINGEREGISDNVILSFDVETGQILKAVYGTKCWAFGYVLQPAYFMGWLADIW